MTPLLSTLEDEAPTASPQPPSQFLMTREFGQLLLKLWAYKIYTRAEAMSAITRMTSRVREESRLEGGLFFCSNLVANGDFRLDLLKKSSLETGILPVSLT